MAYSGKVGLWALQTHEVMLSFSIFALTIREFCPCSARILPSFHLPSSQMKFSRHSFLPALYVETGDLQGTVIPSIPVFYLRGTDVAGVTRSLIVRSFIPGLSEPPPLD